MRSKIDSILNSLHNRLVYSIKLNLIESEHAPEKRDSFYPEL